MVQSATQPRGERPTVDEKRREILAAASTVFRRHGYAATGMREIAAELGMTAGNLYYYFAGKEDLLADCQGATLDALLAEASALAASDGSVIARLRAVIVAHVVCLNETFPGSLAHLEIEALPAELRAPLGRKRRRYERLIEELVIEGCAEGELHVAEPRLATLAVLGALNWTVKWFSGDGARSATEVGERFADLLLDGMKARVA